MVLKRKASHAGSWYASSPKQLSSQLESWLNLASDEIEMTPRGYNDQAKPVVRAIISPHAGYRHSGACAAYAYAQIEPKNIQRIFILGPSHRKRFHACALTQTAVYETPLGNLTVDSAINEELSCTGEFHQMDVSTDEDEHSIEMQLPYIAEVMKRRKGEFTIIPILVGAIDYTVQAKYGQILSKYLKNEECLFVISSDFCHWGNRFSYTYHDKSKGAIHESIEDLDRQGMAHIENIDTRGFQTYLDRYSNTICGRRPIGVFLNAVNELDPGKSLFSFKFAKYVQNRKCMTLDDSSVSYAAGCLTLV